MINPTLKTVLKVLAIIVAVWLLILALAAIGLYFGWTNVAGDQDKDAGAYQQQFQRQQTKVDSLPATSSSTTSTISSSAPLSPELDCRLQRLTKLAPAQASNTEAIWQQYQSTELLDNMLFAAELAAGLDTKSTCSIPQTTSASSTVFNWQDQQRWPVIKTALLKDQATIEQAAKAVNLEPRILVSVALVEQLRLYYTQRELFEKFFEPLKILASANKMAWGVMAIKEKTAIEAESNLQNSSSAFYLGDDYRQLLALSSNNPTDERYQRLTDEKNHYYSFLYGSVIIRQLIEQWNQSGYDISRRPEIIATLFNIGFKNSHPKNNPMVGGSSIEINGRQYSFGSLAFEIYYSPELSAEFPWQLQP